VQAGVLFSTRRRAGWAHRRVTTDDILQTWADHHTLDWVLAWHWRTPLYLAAKVGPDAQLSMVEVSRRLGVWHDTTTGATVRWYRLVATAPGHSLPEIVLEQGPR
jgi:hypothetical protein